MADVTRDSVVHEAISYLYSNGRTAHAPVTAEVKFTQHGSQDQVTKQSTWQPVASQQFTSVKSPVIAGYVPDVTEVPAIAVNFGGSDIFKSVIYTSTQQQAIIIYVDQTTGQNLKSVEQHGDADTTIPYRSKSDLQGYLDNGYLLVKNGYDPADKALSFDNDQNIDQTFYVTLKHDIQTINPEHPGKPGQPINKNPGGPKYGPHTDAKSLTINGTQMIHYVDQDGNSVAPDDNSQHVQFTHEIVIDKVTG